MSRKHRDIPFWAKLGHGKPVTRRDFLSTGIIPFAAWGVAPSISMLLSRSAEAADCSAAPTTSFVPFITLNLSGGPSLASQLVVKNLSGQNLGSYTKLGLGAGPGLSFKPELEFGNVEFSGTAIGGQTQGLVSKFLTGLRFPRGGNMRNASLDKAAFVWSAVSLTDDSSANLLDVTGLVLKMGLAGSKLPNLGRSDTATGINQKPSVVPPPAPFVVGNVNDLTNALGYSSALTNLKLSQKSALARVIARLSGAQIRRIAETPSSQVIADLVECAGVKNIDLIASAGGGVNPYAANDAVSTEIARIWGIQVADRTSQDAVFGAMVYNGLTGNAATINLNLGGYDYHDNTRTTGDTRDLAAGVVVGKILETASYLNKPVFVYICADGATTSAESATADSVWTSDRGIAGMQYMIAFHPAKRPDVSGNQIGGFNEGQAADGSFPTGTSADLAAQAIFANYAAWNDQMAFVEQYRILGDATLRAKAIKLQKKA